MDKAEKDAREIVRLWQANPGMGGEPDLQTRFASALRARDQELAQAREEIARLQARFEKAAEMGSQASGAYDSWIAQLRAERDAAVDCVEALRDKQNWYRNPDEVCTRARACLARLPQAAERAQAVRDVIAAVRTGAPQAVVQRALERLDALESAGPRG